MLLGQAAAAVKESDALGVPRASRGDRVVVGLTGYPNVGKSSTINAIFGSKKTAVAATPGKTKHFQTLFVSDDLCLCDCPGLVMPQFAHSKAEMVAAGVIPIDRLTDVRAPIATVAARVSREQLERVYGFKLPPVPVGQPADRPPTPAELLRSLAWSRGWMGAGGLPDETRAGRRILKDYVDGKILACKPPPGANAEVVALVEEIAGRRLPAGRVHEGWQVVGTPEGQGAEAAAAAAATEQEEDEDEASTSSDGDDSENAGAVPSSGLADGWTDGRDRAASAAAAAPSTVVQEDPNAIVLDAADLDLMDSLDISGKKAKPVRAPHKFHK